MSEGSYRKIEGKLDAKGLKLAVVAARFNNLIVERLVSGAIDSFVRHGGEAKDVTVFMVPGSWEIPSALKDVLDKNSREKTFDAVVCLGAVIRGGTPHFEYVASEMAKGIAMLSVQYSTAVGFGVLTCDSIEQALERSGSKMGNKGAETVVAVLEMCDLKKRIQSL